MLLDGCKIEEMFMILQEYPESLPALEDLKECLERTRQHNELILSLKREFRQVRRIPTARPVALPRIVDLWEREDDHHWD